MAVKYYNYPADSDKWLSAHFQMGEFVTYSDYLGSYPLRVMIDDGLPQTLEKVFEHFKCDKGVISSGYRTPSCDLSVDGSGSGPHTQGIAVDVCFYRDGKAIPSRIIACYLQDIGVKGIGVYCGGTENYTHFDMRKNSVWYGDERDYSSGHDDFYSYTGTSKSEVYPNSSENKPSKMTVGSSAIKFIKEQEGLSLKAVKLSGEDYYTIGYGHYGADVGANQTITEAEAETLLKKDLRIFEDAVNNSVKVTITQNQFDALVCLAYNIGTGAIADSDTVKYLNRGKLGHATVDIPSWRRGMGYQILTGLENRRQKEMKLFGEGCDYTLTASVNVRTGAGTNNRVKKVSEITQNGRKCVVNQTSTENAVFKSGTEVTALELKAVYSSDRVEVWLRCPSGWLCARFGDEVYVN